MRISDWSSDVCSSDLGDRRPADDLARRAERGELRKGGRGERLALAREARHFLLHHRGELGGGIGIGSTRGDARTLDAVENLRRLRQHRGGREPLIVLGSCHDRVALRRHRYPNIVALGKSFSVLSVLVFFFSLYTLTYTFHFY